jgi:hypothetical protein
MNAEISNSSLSPVTSSEVIAEEQAIAQCVLNEALGEALPAGDSIAVFVREELFNKKPEDSR